MSVVSTHLPVLLDAFERLPDKDGIQELLDGVVVEMPPPKFRHSELVKRIAKFFESHVDESRVWIETGFLIGPNCPQPDVAVSHAGQAHERGWFAGAPLIAVEVASRGNTPDELDWKKDLYLANGAREVWIVYEKTRSIAVHSADGMIQYRNAFYSRHLEADFPVPELFRQA